MIFNTIFALWSGTMMAFFTSALFKHGKMSMEHILFGSLAGGVSMASVGSMLLDPY